MVFFRKSRSVLFSILFFFVMFVFSVANPTLIFKNVDTLNLHLKTIFAEPNCESPSPGDIDFCLQRIEEEINALSPANETNKKELSNLKSQITSLTKRISAISVLLEQNSKDISAREEDLAFAQVIFEEKTRDRYKFIRLYDPILPFLSSTDASSAFRQIVFRQKAADYDIRTMEAFTGDLLKLKQDKENLEKNQKELASAKAVTDERAKFLEGEVEKTNVYLSSLSAKQESLLALKAGGFSTTVGDVPESLEPCSGKPSSSNFCDPGFRPAFAAFSYGAPHRKGLSQYGSYGRAKSGQDAETILHAYYGGIEIKKDYPTNINITVSGYGTVDLETYVKRIYEMPASWDVNGSAALKAQAVAARSYALAYTDNGAKPICATESCQVYKPVNKGGAWDAAVDATRGWVMVVGGQPFSAWYASTAGGYTIGYTSQGYSTPNLWDTPSGQGGWPNSAYEVAGGSPWFYKGWYKSRSGASCGRSNPWLTSQEIADILNAWSIIFNGGGDVSRVSPVDTSCWGGNPYSVSELVSIGGFTSVSGASVIYSNSGSTQSVTFQTNKGTQTINGEDFKKAFNLRAPGYIGLKSSLFNIEKL
jgi:peptidoglycan hydrolase CwlO-like protein